MDLGLRDKIALVTGSSRGLGLASARSLVAEGCRVVLTARGAEQLARAAEEVAAVAGGPDRVQLCAADLATPDGIARAVGTAVSAFGGLDVLVNNMGLARGAGLLDTSDAEWQEAFDQTLYPAIRASKLAVPLMRKRGGGVIVMITSIWGRESGGRMTYNVAKAAETSLAKALAQQFAPDNVRVVSVAPGSILFPGGGWERRQKADPDGIAAFVAREIPFGRFGRPDEIGDVVAFLCSPRAGWLTGACIPVDGGQSRAF
jgi:3-oxoacyl-[acyl-carrier protein] reductase